MFNTKRSLLQQTAIQTFMAIGVMSIATPAFAYSDQNLSHDISLAQASKKINLAISGGAVSEALQQIARQAGFQLSGNAAYLKGTVQDPLVGYYTVQEAVGILLSEARVGYRWHDNALIITGRKSSGPQKISYDTDAEYEANFVSYEEDATDDSDTTSFDEIIVTASRRSVSLQDTALSVTAVAPEDFAVGGLVSLRDIIEYTPGVVFTGGSTPIGNTVSMRGISSTVASPTVGIYIDDAPIGSRNPFSKGAELALDAMESNIERVEVIKGPQGTLYGSSSIGGVIRYITKDPSKGEFSGSAKVDLSATKEGGFNQTYSGGLSGPIVQDKVGVSVSGYYKDVTGFIDRDASSATGAAENVNGFETYGITAKLTANPSDELSLSFAYLHTKSEFTGSNVITLDGPPYVPAQGRYASEEGASVRFGTFSLYSGRLE